MRYRSSRKPPAFDISWFFSAALLGVSVESIGRPVKQ
jgi:hypothetical protein